MTNRIAMSGMTAAAYAAYALSDTSIIFPITPASHMAETVEAWSAAGKLNLFGQQVEVQEMQSEKGVAGTVHGCLAGGALTSTFTASQGLMLMIPNMYKIAGELLPAVFHVTCRSLAAHALSIFGDHQDLMAVRQTGFAMLGSASVQECMDLSLVAHLAAIEGSLPFVHFFDGFRTSDEIDTIEPIEIEEMRPLVNWDKIQEFRDRCLDPLHPHIRGTAQNPDVYFQNREAANAYYDALPAIVQEKMDQVAKLTGRSYHLFDYEGAPDAESVIVTMGSSCDVVEETVKYLNGQGAKLGVVKVRLYRPFSAADFLAALPASVKRLCALDRSKEPGSLGEALYQDVCAAVHSAGKDIEVIGGRYGLSSKDFSPAMVKAVFDNMAAREPLSGFTVGIKDDVTHRSLPLGEPLHILSPRVNQCIFYGFGSDGTVGANKQAAKIIGDHSDSYAQCYSWFDSKKSGGLTISYLRFGPKPLRAPYLIDQAQYVACHKDIYVKRGYPLAQSLQPGGVFVLNCHWSAQELDQELPASMRRELATRKARLYTIDANGLAQKIGLGSHINMIMQAVFFKLSGVMDFESALRYLKETITMLYGSQGDDVVQKNLQAVDGALATLHQVPIPQSWIQASDDAAEPKAATTTADKKGGADKTFIDQVFWPLERLEGDKLPVSAFDPAGFVPLGTAAYEKRTVASFVPEWNVHNCIECFQCSLVCPHGAIRPYLATDEELKDAPASYETKPAFLKELKGHHFRIQVYPEDCVGCGSCANNCPAPGKALVMKPLESQLETQKENLAFAQSSISIKDDLLKPDSIAGTQLQQPLLEFSGACAGCGETPHVKLLTQLFGDRLIMANATGCSSIWGAYMPAMPYTTNRRGHGPAWGNSLFEDNGEYGFGIARAVSIRRAQLEAEVAKARSAKDLPQSLATALDQWSKIKGDADQESQIASSIGEALDQALNQARSAKLDGETLEVIQALDRMRDHFIKKSVWAVGGDGWAYDIDFDGIDAALAKGTDLNMLVLDTEGYSNTGGEESKATQLGSVSGFSLNGKPTPKKKLGQMLMQYGYVYVAQVCLGANMNQCIIALREAESYPGPSIVIALCPCISWGIKAGMGTSIAESKHAVEAGYWPLFRFNPLLKAQGKDPLVLDSKAPDGSLESLLDGENRYASLAQREPELSERLRSELAKDGEEGYQILERSLEVYKP